MPGWLLVGFSALFYHLQDGSQQLFNWMGRRKIHTLRLKLAEMKADIADLNRLIRLNDYEYSSLKKRQPDAITSIQDLEIYGLDLCHDKEDLVLEILKAEECIRQEVGRRRSVKPWSGVQSVLKKHGVLLPVK